MLQGQVVEVNQIGRLGAGLFYWPPAAWEAKDTTVSTKKQLEVPDEQGCSGFFFLPSAAERRLMCQLSGTPYISRLLVASNTHH